VFSAALTLPNNRRRRYISLKECSICTLLLLRRVRPMSHMILYRSACSSAALMKICNSKTMTKHDTITALTRSAKATTMFISIVIVVIHIYYVYATTVACYVQRTYRNAMCHRPLWENHAPPWSVGRSVSRHTRPVLFHLGVSSSEVWCRMLSRMH
jgi:hypothetical protein